MNVKQDIEVKFFPKGFYGCDECYSANENEFDYKKYPSLEKSFIMLCLKCSHSEKYRDWELIKKYKVLPDENEEIALKATRKGWNNFFEVIRERKSNIERRDGKSIGNFWAFIQHLQEQLSDFDNH